MKNYFKNLRFGFVWQALIFFALIMISNFIWMFVEAPNDVLRVDTITPAVDITATIFQVCMITVLVFFEK